MRALGFRSPKRTGQGHPCEFLKILLEHVNHNVCTRANHFFAFMKKDVHLSPHRPGVAHWYTFFHKPTNTKWDYLVLGYKKGIFLFAILRITLSNGFHIFLFLPCVLTPWYRKSYRDPLLALPYSTILFSERHGPSSFPLPHSFYLVPTPSHSQPARPSLVTKAFDFCYIHLHQQPNQEPVLSLLFTSHSPTLSMYSPTPAVPFPENDPSLFPNSFTRDSKNPPLGKAVYHQDKPHHFYSHAIHLSAPDLPSLCSQFYLKLPSLSSNTLFISSQLDSICQLLDKDPHSHFTLSPSKNNKNNLLSFSISPIKKYD
jgi:hypothetical protein